jgi:lysozyme family protein
MPPLPVSYNNQLKAEYQHLFDTCVVHPNRLILADQKAKAIHANKARYEKIGAPFNVPWYVVGLIHHMECGLSFAKHLHNGDPLTARTKLVPPGRPVIGKPPFTFEESAADALKLKWAGWKDWSIPGILYKLECYNGLGYRQYHPHVKSPYLWSFTNHYIKGKYVADGKWSETTVSLQLGIAAILRRMVQLDMIDLPS